MNAFLAYASDGEGFDHMGGWGGGWMWLWGVAMMVLFVVLIVWLIRGATQSSGLGGNSPQAQSPRARDILDERYAKGEMTTEEYRERSSELE
ncbi:MAG: SHOCT domain-containing protein [Acidimicrobiales bacterium]